MGITNLDATTYDIRYYEYLIKQKSLCSSDSNCAACYGENNSLPTCKVCNGSSLEERLIRNRTDNEECTCNDGYFDNGNQ